MKCKKCGAEVKGNYCPNCGAKVEKSNAKTVIIIVAAVCAIILIRACMSGIVIADLNEPDKTPLPLTTTEPTAEPDIYVLDTSAIKVQYVSHELVTNYDNETLLLVKFEYTNKAKDPKSFGWATTIKAYQDGVEIESSPVSWLKNETPVEYQNRWLEVQQGTTITAAETFKLRNMESPVDITVMEWPGIGSEKTELTLDIK